MPNLKTVLILFCFIFDDFPVLIKNFVHSSIPLEHIIIQPDVCWRKVCALNEEGEAVFRIHQSLAQFNHVSCLYFLNISLQEDKNCKWHFKEQFKSKHRPWKHFA